MAALLSLVFAASAPSLAYATAAGSGFTTGLNVASAQREFATMEAERLRDGLRALHSSGTLTRIAQARATDMGLRDYFSHQIPPSGQYVFDVYGASISGWALWGENIGWLQGCDVASYCTDLISRMFWGSPEHRANILGRYTHMGVGVYRTPDGRTYFAVEFWRWVG